MPIPIRSRCSNLPTRFRSARSVLAQLVDSPAIGAEVRQIVVLLDEGERAVKADPTRIRRNIERLTGPPRGFQNALERLKDSGEYAIPFLIEYLRDREHAEYLRPIVRALPQIDRPAVNPLVMALQVARHTATPASGSSKPSARSATARPCLICSSWRRRKGSPTRFAARSTSLFRASRVPAPRSTPVSVRAEAFYTLADQYYDSLPSLAADPRLDTANVW